MNKYMVFFLLAVVLICAGCSYDAKADVTTPQQNSVAKQENTKIVPPSFGLTLDDFKQKYNEQCLNNGFSEDCMIRNIDVSIENNEKNFKCHIIRNTYIYGTISQVSGEVTVIHVSTYPIKSELVIADGFSVQAIVSCTIAPNLTPPERRKILEKLGVLDNSLNKNGLELSTEYQNVRYTINSSKEKGVNFIFIALKK